MKKLAPAVATVLILIPSFALAAERLGALKDLIRGVGDVVQLATVVVSGMALLAFFWGLARFIYRANDAKTAQEGKEIMKWGLIALFVMVSVWGIIAMVQRELGLPVTTPDQGTPSSLNQYLNENPTYRAAPSPSPLQNGIKYPSTLTPIAPPNNVVDPIGGPSGNNS